MGLLIGAALLIGGCGASSLDPRLHSNASDGSDAGVPNRTSTTPVNTPDGPGIPGTVPLRGLIPQWQRVVGTELEQHDLTSFTLFDGYFRLDVRDYTEDSSHFPDVPDAVLLNISCQDILTSHGSLPRTSAMSLCTDLRYSGSNATRLRSWFQRQLQISSSHPGAVDCATRIGSVPVEFYRDNRYAPQTVDLTLGWDPTSNGEKTSRRPCH